jgi:hypothetical protein
MSQINASNEAGAGQAPANMVFVALSELRELCTKSLSTLGYSPQEVSVLLEVSRDHHVQLCMKQHVHDATPTGSWLLCCAAGSLGLSCYQSLSSASLNGEACIKGSCQQS